MNYQLIKKILLKSLRFAILRIERGRFGINRESN